MKIPNRLKQIGASNLIGIPSYLVNNAVMIFLLAHFQNEGLLNVPAVWIGDGAGIAVNSAILPYWLKILNRWEKKASPSFSDTDP